MERYETVIVGGGQAGLATAYELKRRGRSFIVLDANDRIGDSWRKRWDSLRLFTPAMYDGLPGMRFPAPRWSFPTKDEMGDYLESYAERFELPTRSGVSVDRVCHDGERYLVESGHDTFEAENVVIASGAHRVPKTPAFAGALDPRIVQVHSVDYRNSSQLAAGPALVVGVGNSGAEIAFELSRSHSVFVSGRPAGEIPVRHGSLGMRLLLPAIRFFGTHVLNVKTPVGRKAQPRFVVTATPLIRVKSKALSEAGVEPVERVVGTRDGRPLLEDGRVLDVANVIWCTGFRYELSWLDLPVLGPDGAPRHDRGVAQDLPGLYFVGLLFQTAATSDVLPGVGRDASYIAGRIDKRVRETRANGRRPVAFAA